MRELFGRGMVSDTSQIRSRITRGACALALVPFRTSLSVLRSSVSLQMACISDVKASPLLYYQSLPIEPPRVSANGCNLGCSIFTRAFKNSEQEADTPVPFFPLIKGSQACFPLP